MILSILILIIVVGLFRVDFGVDFLFGLVAIVNS